jgi:hypothetical protein
MVSVAEDTFEATCEGCAVSVELSPAEVRALVGEDGSFRCAECSTAVWRAKRRGRLSRLRRHPRSRVRYAGCIVSVRYFDGGVATFHERGEVVEALQTIVDRIPRGSARVMAISSPATILRDLEGPRPDPYIVERTLLGLVGRLDLLPK